MGRKNTSAIIGSLANASASKKLGGVVVVFKSKKGVAYAKRFRNSQAALRAEEGLKKVGSRAVSARVAKGYKFGAVVKRLNRNK